MRLAPKSLAFVAASSLLLVGCAGGGTADSADADAATTAQTPAEDTETDAAAPGGEPCTGAIGVMAPITGGAAAIGVEQLNFVKLAVDQFNEANGSSFTVVEGDTQLDAGQASTVAQQFVSNADIIGVVGPAGSQEVESVGPTFGDANLAFVSSSATATGLTEGHRFPTFARVIPNDSVQGPTVADYIATKLQAKKVVVVEEKTSYGTGLADAVETGLTDAGVEVQRVEAPREGANYDSIATLVPNDADVVFVTFQVAANSKTLANLLQQQGKSAVVFGSDGSFSSDFDVPGQYVSAFAPDITNIPEAQDVATAFTDAYGEFGTYGPPTFVAAQVILDAASKDCDGTADREATSNNLLSVSLPETVLGGPLSFEDNGDVKDAQFYIFQIDDSGQMQLATD